MRFYVSMMLISIIQITVNAMTATSLKLLNPPIVEAVVDFDCEMPLEFDLAAMEGKFARAFQDKYPMVRQQIFQGFQLETTQGVAPKISAGNGLQAIQLFTTDDKQLVQMRAGGFSFNRLAPYSSLDNYLTEIQNAWQIYIKTVNPKSLRQIQLRYVNKLLLPTINGRLDLDDYFTVGPKAPDEERLAFVGFLHQHAMFDQLNNNKVNTVIAAQPPEGDKFPVIFDISVQYQRPLEIQQWDSISAALAELRELKNLVFKKMLTTKCLNLFQ